MKTKVTLAQATAMRELYAADPSIVTLTRLAEQYGISVSGAFRIAKGERRVKPLREDLLDQKIAEASVACAEEDSPIVVEGVIRRLLISLGVRA